MAEGLKLEKEDLSEKLVEVLQDSKLTLALSSHAIGKHLFLTVQALVWSINSGVIRRKTNAGISPMFPHARKGIHFRITVLVLLIGLGRHDSEKKGAQLVDHVERI